MIHLKTLQALFSPNHHGHNVEFAEVYRGVLDVETTQLLASVHKLPAAFGVVFDVFIVKGQLRPKAGILAAGVDILPANLLTPLKQSLNSLVFPSST